jgi:hypothetical protein
MRNKTDIIKAIAIAAFPAFGLTAAGLAVAEPAAPPTPTPPEMSSGPSDEYTRLDTDKDGAINKREARRNKDLVKKWNSLDVNKDGKLDQGEFAQFEAQPSGPDADKPKEAPKATPPVM